MSDEYMTLVDADPLNDAETVGTVAGIEPADTTVEFQDVGYEVTKRFGQHAIADDDSRVFIGSDGGELTTSLAPLFDVPISSNFEVRLALSAISAIQGEDGPDYRPSYVEFDVLFDDGGPVVFRSRETGLLAAVCPVKFKCGVKPVETERPDMGPMGPTGRGEVSDDE